MACSVRAARPLYRAGASGRLRTLAVPKARSNTSKSGSSAPPGPGNGGGSEETGFLAGLDFLKSAQALVPASWDGSLVVDDDQHKALIQQAHHDKTLSFGFSAGGTLFPYYVGVAGALQDAGVITEETKIGGASAGSLIAACVKSGLPMDEVMDRCLAMMHDCRVNGTMHRLGPLLETLLEEALPADAHERCRERAYVAVTRALPYFRAELVTQFDSRADLIRALRTSCHIPYYLDGKWYTDFRGEAHVDGGLTNFIPIPPGTVGVRVCCFPSKQLSRLYRIGISVDSFEDWPYTLAQTVRWALEPASEEFVTAFVEKGRRDAMAWAVAQGLVAEAVKAEAAQAAATGQAAAARTAAAGTSQPRAQVAEAGEQGAALHALAEAEGGQQGRGQQPAQRQQQGQQEQQQEEQRSSSAGPLAKVAGVAAGATAAVAAAATVAGTIGSSS